MAAAPSTLHAQSSCLALLAAAALLITCAGFSIGLTFAPCHSSICVEHWFPFQTRIHIAVFYGSIAILAICLVARSESQTMRSISHRYIFDKPLLLLGAWISVGGLLTSVWVVAFTLLSTAYWFPAEHAFWLAKGSAAGWTQYMFRVTWAGVTGHWCDVLFGLVFLPVGRDNVFSAAFGVQTSTLLFAHKILAYTLCAFGLIHGLLYYSFLAAWVANATIEPIFAAFNPDNPFYTWKQVEQLGIYGWFALPTGAAAGIVLIPTMLISALPVIRRKYYNVFYYVHVTFAVLVLVLLCLHASTNFYFVLPGLLLWVYDWAHRLRRALFYRKAILVENAGFGWYRMRLPHIAGDIADAEKAVSVQEAATTQLHPLETYYVRLRSISAIQIHPFTAAAPASPSSGPVLLFRKSSEKKKASASAAEWTWKLGAMVDASPTMEPVVLEARIEGPYLTSVPELYAADHVLAIVGGTGITGALSLASWWLSWQNSTPSPSQQQQPRLRIVWSIRDISLAKVSEVHALQERLAAAEQTAELQIHDSSRAGRIDAQAVLEDFVGSESGSRGNVFVYISGPEGLAASAEAACIRQKRRLLVGDGDNDGDGGGDGGGGGGIGGRMDLNWHNASFTV